MKVNGSCYSTNKGAVLNICICLFMQRQSLKGQGQVEGCNSAVILTYEHLNKDCM